MSINKYYILPYNWWPGFNEKTDAITEKRRLAPTNLSNPPLFTGLMVPIRKALNDLLRAIREEGVGPENEDEL